MVQSNVPILQLNNIHLFYGDVPVLNGVDFDLYRGEIHALVGEHRAGKSSLVRILSGEIKKYKGSVILNGKNIDYFTPKKTINYRIGIVSQKLNIIPSLNAVDNIFAGRMPFFWLKRFYYNKITVECKKLFDKLGVKINLKIPVLELSIAEQQMIEIARVLSIDPEIIILDEISNKLTAGEMDHLFYILKEFVKQGKAVIYISPNIDEVFKFADRVTVLKNGLRRGTELVKDLDRFKLVKMAYSFMLNIEEYSDKNEELFFIKKKNESIINDLPIGVIILDVNNDIYFVNESACKIFNYEENKSSSKSLVKIFKNSKINKIDDIMEKIINKERYIWDGISVKNEKFVKIKSFPLRNEDYIFLGTILMIEDVSMDHFIKAYLLRAEKIESIAELASGVAHEIKNPLGIMQNYIELLKMKKNDKDTNEKIYKIENELNRIVNIISSLFSFSKFNQLSMKKINLSELLEEIILLLSHMMNKKYIILKKNINQNNIMISGIENRLKQLFINIITNSIEAVLDHGIIEISLKADKANGYAEVQIRDNGYGIPIEIQEEIFTPFFTTKLTKKNTGLGLSICQHIIEAHNGIITFKSDPGEKTTFFIKLPI